MGNLIARPIGNVFFGICLVLSLMNCSPTPASVESPVYPNPVILDTDISADVDDVGAVSLLHALADKGDIEIIGVMVSSGDPWSTSCIDALNTYLGRPDIPIGAVRDEGVVHRSAYTQKIADEYPHDIGISSAAEDAVVLYRKLLATGSDRSIVIVSVGFLTNLKNLILSPADDISPMDGMALVQTKVKRLVCMGGKYPSGREWNFYQDASSARHVVNHWPTPIIFVGFETGVDVLTGSALKQTHPRNPVRRSYLLHNNLSGRPSWDQLAVLYAAKMGQPAYAGYWDRVVGKNKVADDGSNIWTEKPDGHHAYIRLTKPPKTFELMIEQLMTAPLSGPSKK